MALLDVIDLDDFGSKFYVNKPFFLTMVKSGRGFGLEIMKKLKLKKTIKTKII